MEIKHVNLWKITNSFPEVNEYGQEGVTYEYVIENGETYIYMGIDPDDGYRSHAVIEFSDDSTDFAAWEKKLVGAFSAINIKEEDAHDMYLYRFYDGNVEIGYVCQDDRDEWYPHGDIIFDLDKIEEIAFIPMEIVFPKSKRMFQGNQRKVINLSEKKASPQVAIILTGEPRVGKTTFCEKYVTVPWYDTDELGKANQIIEKNLGKYRVFVVGKYRNIQAKTDRGEMSFVEVLSALLQDAGFEVYEMKMLERVEQSYTVSGDSEAREWMNRQFKENVELFFKTS